MIARTAFTLPVTCAADPLKSPKAYFDHASQPPAGNPKSLVLHGTQTENVERFEVLPLDLKIEMVQHGDSLLTADVMLGDVPERDYRCHEYCPCVAACY